MIIKEKLMPLVRPGRVGVRQDKTTFIIRDDETTMIIRGKYRDSKVRLIKKLLNSSYRSFTTPNDKRSQSQMKQLFAPRQIRRDFSICAKFSQNLYFSKPQTII
uniref:Uncharacterized protein n=1 Tax=Candidatus Kentrum sp. TC TaxID=2126339 RepID=A0A450YQG1_9GAMM|nr:MAG: hypothetical protein BECKTC1821E_GA0114239_102819 [Candidatus Kentron sp. TC]